MKKKKPMPRKHPVYFVYQNKRKPTLITTVMEIGPQKNFLIIEIEGNMSWKVMQYDFDISEGAISCRAYVLIYNMQGKLWYEFTFFSFI